MKFLLLLALGVMAATAEEDQTLKEFKDGNVLFTADVYKEMLKSQSGNFLVCPLSVDVILALVHAGAKGNTAKQLSSSLRLPESHEKIKETFTKLAPSLQGNDKYTLSSANKVYVKKGFKISDSFKSTAVDVFKSEIQNIDFENTEPAAQEMNKWVEEKTHDKIKNLIRSDDLDADTSAVLINALYFKGTWKTQFNESATKKKPFHLNKKKQIDVDMMELIDYFNYYESPELNAKFLEMPYEGDDVTMTFVLPNDVDGLPALEAKIAKVLTKPEYSWKRVHVQIPKYKIESTIQFKPILKSLGVVDAFEDYANFTGIGAQQELLKISNVIQKAFVEVEEKGTTAAAATAVITSFIRIPAPPPAPPKEFITDHPFIYVLRNSAGILFVGHYVNGPQ